MRSGTVTHEASREIVADAIRYANAAKWPTQLSEFGWGAAWELFSVHHPSARLTIQNVIRRAFTILERPMRIGMRRVRL